MRLASFSAFLSLVVLLPVHVFALINPILPGFNPDPTIVRVGSDYFITTSTCELYPGYPIYHSKNLVDWKLIGHGLNRPSQLSLLGTPADAGLWAPGLRYHKGTYYLIGTARYAYTAEYKLFPRSFYVTTKDIFSNKWSDPIYFDSLGYDAELYWEPNGDVISTWCGINNAVDKIYGIWQNKIDIATGNSLTEAKLIDTGTLENNASARPESPHIYKRKGVYYLLIAEGGTDIHHRASIKRGPTISGPWESNPANPILFNGANLSLPIQATGHVDFVEAADGKWWGVGLAVRTQNGNYSHQQLGRETYLFPVTWKDGWPVINGGKPLTEHLAGVLKDKSPVHSYYNDFTSRTLDLTFSFLRTPYKAFHSLTARRGYLRLSANSYAPGDRDNVAILLRKQVAYQETFETELDFQPTSDLTEAGVSLFNNDFLHWEIAVVGDVNRTGTRYIRTRTVLTADATGQYPLTILNNTITTVTHTPLKTKTGPVKLRIIGNSDSYTLAYAEGKSTTFNATATFDSVTLSGPPPMASFFKGAMFGIYSTGNGKPSLVPADFKYWKQTLTS